ncbi:MAG: NblA/ycf18 family protein [Cyanobacteria bacterium P01_H01_bin.121]
MDNQTELSLEQKFELRVFAERVQSLSQEEAQQFLVQLREAMLVQANLYREIIKDTWGIDQGVDAFLKQGL